MVRGEERHPVVTGLIALGAVGVVVGLIVGVIAIVAGHVLGIGGSSSASGVDDGASLYLPTPSVTQSATGPLITLSPVPGSSDTSVPTSSAPASESSSADDDGINLAASTTSVSAMQQFQLTGTFPAGEGHILRVQRKGAGASWQDFGIPDVDVEDGEFATPVQTGRTGVNFFRVKDVDTGKTSNTVSVTIE